MQTNWSPPYAIRQSKRARRLQLRVLSTGDIEVIIPPFCTKQEAIEFLNENREWIEKQWKKTPPKLPGLPKTTLPSLIHLRATSQVWAIEYQNTPSQQVRINLKNDNELLVKGAIENEALCQQRLKHWLKRQAEQIFSPWLYELSLEIALPYNKLTIRAQSSCWGSCTNKYNISLNYKLLFFPNQVVEYVMIHELCHTQHMDHSSQFWQLLATFEANYKEHISSLKNSKYLPEWLGSETFT